MTIQETTMNNSARLPRRLATAIFAALTCVIATGSFASGSFDDLRVKVKYGDLDVSSASGAATLYRRIQGAAEAVCRPWKHGDLYNRTIFHACMKKTITNAINEINQPALFTIANANATGKGK
jgi:UrcA family protein